MRTIDNILENIFRLDLPFDLHINLFNKTVKPILLYSCKIWRHGDLDILERIQLSILQHTLNLKMSTPSLMICGDLGITPIAIDLK